MPHIKTNTRVIREIMRKHGHRDIYTNKYKNCRTVKCYSNPRTNTKMFKELMTELKQHGMEFEIKITKAPYKWSTAGVVIRVPITY